jgi:hypothetical protein
MLNILRHTPNWSFIFLHMLITPRLLSKSSPVTLLQRRRGRTRLLIQVDSCIKCVQSTSLVHFALLWQFESNSHGIHWQCRKCRRVCELQFVSHHISWLPLLKNVGLSQQHLKLIIYISSRGHSIGWICPKLWCNHLAMVHVVLRSQLLHALWWLTIQNDYTCEWLINLFVRK